MDMDPNQEMIVGMIGLGLVIVGVWALAGWPLAVTISGVVLLVTAFGNS